MNQPESVFGDVRANPADIVSTTQHASAPEPMARFCPGCGSVGDVPGKFRDCCPDGGRARVIPAALAGHCHDLFVLALNAAAPAPTEREQSMAMSIRRIVSAARRHCEDDSPVLKLANGAWSYLVREGLHGSPLRDEAPSTSGAAS